MQFWSAWSPSLRSSAAPWRAFSWRDGFRTASQRGDADGRVRFDGGGRNPCGPGSQPDDHQREFILQCERRGRGGARGRDLKLDRTLQRYGTETAAARDALRTYAKAKVQDISEEELGSGLGLATLKLLETVDDRILALRAVDDRQTHLRGDALTMIHGMSRSRWTLVSKSETAVSSPFLGLLILWLALLFATFGLFAPRNATVIAVLLLSAVAIAGGILMILELGSATGGLIRISVDPLIAAVAELDGNQS